MTGRNGRAAAHGAPAGPAGPQAAAGRRLGGVVPQGAWVLIACTVRIGLGGGPLIQTLGASDFAAP